jgi:branched-chain amino acid transport system substrate-binding protein
MWLPSHILQGGLIKIKEEVMRRSVDVRIAAVLLGALILMLLPTMVQGQTKAPVKIGVILPMTGPAALFGEQTNRGVQLAAKLINDAGGILGGRPVKIYLEDDQANPVEGVNAVKKLMNREGTKLITGGVNSSVSLAELQVTKESGLLHLVTVSTAPAIREQGHPSLFALQPTNTMKDDFALPWIAQNLKPQKVVVLAENTDYGRVELDELKKNWGNSGPKIIATEMFQLGESDFAINLNKFKAMKPDLFYIATAAPNTLGAILKQAYEIGFKTPIFLAPGNLNMDVIRLAGPAMEGIMCADYYVNILDTPANKKFVMDYEEMYKKPPEKMEMLGYESITILSGAINKSGTDTDVKKISDTLRENKWPSPRGEIVFDQKGQAKGVTKDQVLYVKDGKIALRK